MITAQIAPLDVQHPQQSHLKVVFKGPAGFEKDPVIVADRSEAKRLVYFYNRLYIAETLKKWLRHRAVIFNHVLDLRKEQMAEHMLYTLTTCSKTSLDHVCQFVIQQELNIKTIAPGERSRHYANYRTLVLPVIEFCKEIGGAKS